MCIRTRCCRSDILWGDLDPCGAYRCKRSSTKIGGVNPYLDEQEASILPYADNQGVRVHYQIEGNGPPLVLQHGFMQSIDDWFEAGLCRYLEGRLPPHS